MSDSDDSFGEFITRRRNWRPNDVFLSSSDEEDAGDIEVRRKRRRGPNEKYQTVSQEKKKLYNDGALHNDGFTINEAASKSSIYYSTARNIVRMLSTPDTWSWQFALALFMLLAFFLPFSSNLKVRYYAVYVCYVFYVSFTAILLTPYFIVRARNIENLTLAGKLLKNLTKVLGIKWTVRNEHILAKNRGAIITANHQSILDIMGMFNIWETMAMCTAVAKKEIMYVVPFGPVAWLAGLVYIDRSNPKRALETIQMSSHIIHDLKAKLWLFPEGTRNKKGQKLLPFKRGAFKSAIDSQAPIIPVVFSPYYFIDGHSKTFDRGEVIISVLDEIPTEGLKAEDANELMNKTYDIMAKEYDKLKVEMEDKYYPKKNTS